MRVKLNREVYSDLESIMEWYLRKAVAGIAGDFYQEFIRCRWLLRSRAKSYPVVRNDVRRMNLHRFPHHILYQIVDDEFVKILAIKHDSRDPSFGYDRT